MLDHYLAVGGNEIINSARAYGYATTADCPASWLEDPECETLRFATASDSPYIWEAIGDAPWFDPDDPDTSSRFLGLMGVEIQGLSDSTRTAQNTQLSSSKSRVTGYRHGSREVRVRGWLTARGGDALELGHTWLNNALEPDACGMHGGKCKTSDAAFFVDCPPPRGTVVEIDPEDPDLTTERPQTDAEYLDTVDDYRRYLHSVRAISGPFTLSERWSSDGMHVGRLVEFTLIAEVPWVYGATKPLVVPPTIPRVVQDVAYNLVTRPSGEIAGDDVVIASNFVANPSVETNANGWSFAVGAEPGAPSGPRNFTYTRVGRAITLRWDAPEDAGASPITEWEILYGDGESGATYRIPAVGPGPYTHVHDEPGYIDNPALMMFVSGVNGAGAGDETGPLYPYPELSGGPVEPSPRNPTWAGPSVVSDFVTGARNGDLAAPGAGSWSYRVRVAGSTSRNEAGSGQRIIVYTPNVSLDDLPDDSRPSVSVWVAGIKVDNAPDSRFTSIAAYAVWGTVGPSSTPPVQLLEPVTTPAGFAGTTFWAGSLERPADAVGLTVVVVATVDWVSSTVAANNSDLRLYVDASAVTVP